MYKRILLKLSGEQLQGSRESGIDPEFLHWLAAEIKKVQDLGCQIVIIVGGGNLVRGESFAKNGIERTTADYMGMLATIMNGMALTDVLEQNGMYPRLMTRLESDPVAEPYIRRKALRHLEKNRIVLIAGGTGNPYVTTDTASVLAAIELDCEAVLKATKVDGVYNKDPRTNPDAQKYDQLTLQQALENPDIKVMDKSAMAMALDQNQTIVVFDLLNKGNIAKVASGESIGTVVK
jgi:uridylate kinase